MDNLGLFMFVVPKNNDPNLSVGVIISVSDPTSFLIYDITTKKKIRRCPHELARLSVAQID